MMTARQQAVRKDAKLLREFASLFRRTMIQNDPTVSKPQQKGKP